MFLVELDLATYTVLSSKPVEYASHLTLLSDHYLLAQDAPDLGAVFNPETKVFGTPARRRWLTKLAFDNRFTMPEAIALKLAQMSPVRGDTETEAAFNGRCQLAAQLQVMQSRLNLASYIDLDRADTIAGVQALESLGLLDSGRADEILTGAIAAHEYHPEA